MVRSRLRFSLTLASLGGLAAVAHGQTRIVSWGTSIGPNPTHSDIVQISTGTAHAIGLRSTGQIVLWGSNYAGQLNPPSGLPSVIEVAAGPDNSAALLADRTVRVWGANNWYQQNIPQGMPPATWISGGRFHSVARLVNGAVVAWGTNSSGECLGTDSTGAPIIDTPVGQYSRVEGLVVTNTLAVGGGGAFTIALLGPGGSDPDGDGFASDVDNCPLVWNPLQQDCDDDGVGDACESGGDIDGNGIPDSCECVADLFRDQLVNGADLGVVLTYWGPVTSSSASRAADLNRDGVVDGTDLGHLLSNWGPCSAP